MLVATVPLALRRRFPLTVLWGVVAALLMAPDSLARSIFYMFVIATYSAVVHSPYPVPTLASVPACLLVISLLARNPELPDVPTEYVPFLILIPLAAVASGIRIWRLFAGDPGPLLLGGAAQFLRPPSLQLGHPCMAFVGAASPTTSA